MNTFDDILTAYTKQVQLPWAYDTPPTDRVWIVWYDKALQRRFTGRLGEFEHATLKAGHGWRQMMLSPWFGKWIAKHEFFEALTTKPSELRGLLPDIEDALVRTLREELARAHQTMFWRSMAVALCLALPMSRPLSAGLLIGFQVGSSSASPESTRAESIVFSMLATAGTITRFRFRPKGPCEAHDAQSRYLSDQSS